MPADHGHEYAAAIHPTHCMDFLGSAFRRWLDLPGHGPEVLSNTFPQLFGTGRRPPCPICYLDNAAIAAERLRSRFANVAILDIDDHHVDGIQSIFYDHTDVIGDCLEAFLSGLDS
ncbi:hypothetical protein [Paracoccus benzoatiresistens]|uniref:Histone deacetylase domain-containing protein n=1 Tax=Paracoccus benzoatiresistens TaxID=2997341 RepID=A0ABT4J806_9RHOB|nr:hypothetical protein [Paracoccus sp. EF6]MCZ0963259.1 hypothetical protein [Paracoccus sp. EF6]